MGTLNIIDWCKENGNPEPTWTVRDQSVITTFLPSVFFATGMLPEELKALQQRPESGLESGPESLENEVLNALQNVPLSMSELTKKLGHKNVSSGLRRVIHKLLKQGKISYMIPEKPNSRLQKYRRNE